MKKRDIILILIVAILIGQFIIINKFINKDKGDRVEIYLKNKLYGTYSLDKEKKIYISDAGNKNVLKIHDNGIEMIETNCPDKVCVKTGFISKPGQSIVCLPHKLNVKIVSDDESKKENDVIAQ
ncbi:NusG domain II-containing protein [Peptostreptococcus equinus]|uniref:NusG domain II-containing protein n=1 Tax=Peptostreptococcus equinus TaxID=3003601 RepID=A0ABY7JPY5_9FIRM|nr:NusG domain II-containing protein [Peptostreptococcus sp. CBA3647]WAW14012.1 NusG domain II-containing protein [Peptostreptococcus sp. CBA3647]